MKASSDWILRNPPEIRSVPAPDLVQTEHPPRYSPEHGQQCTVRDGNFAPAPIGDHRTQTLRWIAWIQRLVAGRISGHPQRHVTMCSLRGISTDTRLGGRCLFPESGRQASSEKSSVSPWVKTPVPEADGQVGAGRSLKRRRKIVTMSVDLKIRALFR